MKKQQEARNNQGRRISQTAEMCSLDSLPRGGMLQFSYCETKCDNITSLDNRMFSSPRYGQFTNSRYIFTLRHVTIKASLAFFTVTRSQIKGAQKPYEMIILI